MEQEAPVWLHTAHGSCPGLITRSPDYEGKGEEEGKMVAMMVIPLLL